MAPKKVMLLLFLLLLLLLLRSSTQDRNCDRGVDSPDLSSDGPTVDHGANPDCIFLQNKILTF
jgi:hypothetical protein